MRRAASSTRRAPRSKWRSGFKPDYATAHENLGDVYARLAAQSYNRAQQLDAGNKTVAPKLALVRQLFGTAQAAAPAPIPPVPPRRTVGRTSK